MSTTSPIAAPPETAPVKDRWRRRGRRTSNSGNALVARGEPLVWLTGGALIFTGLMIAGLLTLVFIQGIGTFWPKPILRIALTDESVLLGEIARVEERELRTADLALLTPAQADAARRLLNGAEERKIARRLVRVGNFELTQEHFRRIDDFDILPSGESLPEWAVVLERVEWGRFYGEPEAFFVRTPRPISGDEEQLARIVTFLEQNIPRLTEPGDVPDSLMTDLQSQLKALRIKSTESLFEQRRAQPTTGTLEVTQEDGTVVPMPASAAARTSDGAGDPLIATEVREVWKSAAEAWREFQTHHTRVRGVAARQKQLERDSLGEINRALEESRLKLRAAEMRMGLPLVARAEQMRSAEESLNAILSPWEEQQQTVRQIERRLGVDSPAATVGRKLLAVLKTDVDAARGEPEAQLAAARSTLAALPPEGSEGIESFLESQRQGQRDTLRVVSEIEDVKRESGRYELQMRTIAGQSTALRAADVVRGYPANQLTFGGRLKIYLSRWWEFLSDEPREANSEGGVFPAIWGTVTMTLIMSLAVVPFGVLAALYLREYARGGIMVSAVRIAVNNLAGVPSIVFGVFGLGFFCYIVGAYIDGGPKNAGITPWPAKTWLAAATALAVTAVTAFFFGLFSLTSRRAEASPLRRWLRRGALVLWLTATVLLIFVIARTPYFGGFYAPQLPNPTYGKGGLIWASLTLSLMTLPVVIVATEEALAAVPNSMREGSYACGASKWQTIQRIVLPRALPGIMTGMILAMARGAGEVAPLMLVGAVKLAPDLPLDMSFPFLHPDRSFMHLGFHIYDLGFQIQNSDASRPMVFTTTLVLITIIVGLNLTAVWLRARLRQRYKVTQF